MKKVILAMVAVAVVGFCSTSAEAGHRYARRVVRGRVYAPVVRVRPRYVAPVVARSHPSSCGVRPISMTTVSIGLPA